MAEYLLLQLAQVTLFSSVTALLLLFVRLLFRCRIPPKVGMAMWLILLVRVVCPVFPESPLSIYNFLPVGREIAVTLTYEEWSEVAEAVQPAEKKESYVLYEEPIPSVQGLLQPDDASFDKDESAEVSENTDSAAVCILIIYISGAVTAMTLHYVLYRKAVRKVLKRVSPCFDNALEAQYRWIAGELGIRRIPELYMGDTAMTVGFFCPVIVLSREKMTDDREREMILTHELLHYKHLDNQILLLSTVMCCLFWYNPLLWLVRKHLREDVELLCDVRTLRSGDISVSDYAKLLCRCSHLTEPGAVIGTSMSASGRLLKQRLISISHHNKRRFLSKVTSVLLTVAIVTVCLTNPIVSEEYAYRVYVRNIALLNNVEDRELYQNDQMRIHDFLHQMDAILTYIGGDSLARKVGSGSLENLKRLAAQSEYVDAALAREVENLSPSERLRIGGCSILLNCMMALLSEGRSLSEVRLVPERISVSTLEEICRKLTAEQADMLKSCYNRGITGVNVSFDYLYSNAMMELIMERINDEWARDKLVGFYQEINLDPEDLGMLSSRLNDTIRYVGIGKRFYLCDPNINGIEEAVLREILGAAVAGQREDVYYLKETEDGCSYEAAEQFFRLAGYTVEDMILEYAEIGVSAYQYVPPEEYTMISEYDIRKYSEQLSEPDLIHAFDENFLYRESYTYNNTEGAALTVPFHYYVVDEENSETCQSIMSSMLTRLNAVAFPKLRDTESLDIRGTLSAAEKEAVLHAMQYGFLDFGEEKVYVNEEISVGKCAMILCRFMAAMTNSNR